MKEAETLCVTWLSGRQWFSFIKDINVILEEAGKDKIYEQVNVDINPVVGAIAVKYPENRFSVFIGIAMGYDEAKDIEYIKKMGQRTTSTIARAIFPQFDNLGYHS